jgi:hypothetical protein
VAQAQVLIDQYHKKTEINVKLEQAKFTKEMAKTQGERLFEI